MNLIKRLWSILTGGRLVWLKDHDGTVTLAIARQDAFGALRAERHWPWNIRSVILLPNGTVVGGLYVQFWVDATGSSRRSD